MKKKLCFVSLGSYPLLAQKNLGYVGGAEVQQVLLARELLRYGFEISFVTYNHGGPPIEEIKGIKVVKVYTREDAYKLNPLIKARSIWKAMRYCDADIYFHEAGPPGVVSIFCYFKEKKFIYYIPSDANVRKYPHLINKSLGNQMGNWLDIKLADVVLCQSESQKKMFMKNFQRKSLVVKNAFPISGSNESARLKKTDPPIVMWVATISPVKQPELFLKLAKSIPEGNFQMIGGPGADQGFYHRIKEASRNISNLDFVGFVPFHKIDYYFKRASILVNTSIFEGFSNTFIQAWLNYIPVISLNSDPDEIICEYKLGFHSKTFQRLVDDVRTLLKDEYLRRHMGENGRKYVEKEHDITKIVHKYIEIFNSL